MLEGYRKQPERICNSHSSNNLSNKMNNAAFTARMWTGLSDSPSTNKAWKEKK